MLHCEPPGLCEPTQYNFSFQRSGFYNFLCFLIRLLLWTLMRVQMQIFAQIFSRIRTWLSAVSDADPKL